MAASRSVPDVGELRREVADDGAAVQRGVHVAGGHGGVEVFRLKSCGLCLSQGEIGGGLEVGGERAGLSAGWGAEVDLGAAF
jgi:hypothetical protein